MNSVLQHIEEKPHLNAIKPVGPVVVSDEPKEKKRKKKTKSKKQAEEPKNLFSDKTALFLIRWIKGKKELPETIALPSVRTTEKERENTSDKPDVQEELAEAIRERIRPWLWSILLHACLLVLLACMFLPRNHHDKLMILSGIGDEETEIDLKDLFGRKLESDLTIITPQELPPIDIPLAKPPETEIVDDAVETAAQEPSNKPPGLSFFGDRLAGAANREGGSGGNGETQRAVIEGLRWLVRVQTRDGSWHLMGPYRDGATRDRENKIAATAMALLAFQGYGVTPDSKYPAHAEFTRSVRNGWDWLLRMQDPRTGAFFRDGLPNSHRFYTHGLCTIAICEFYAMTGDESLREPAQKAIDFCVQNQSQVGGGWRYNADRWNPQSDVSVTGWIVMALKSGEAAGLTVPPTTYDEISRFLDEMTRDGSQYCYRMEEREIRTSMTAEALLCRELLGWRQNDKRLERGVRILVEPENLPNFEDYGKRDAYCWYYATQTLHHYGGEPWKIWNEKMRELLPKHQETRGFEAGSWDPNRPVKDEWGRQFGRLYTTCLSIYMLEVYYRHARIYR